MEAHPEAATDPSLYERDFQRWATEQAQALRAAGALRPNLPQEVDWEHLVEEVEGLARSNRYALESRMTVLLMHLLKWLLQERKRSGSWQSTIIEQRRRARARLDDSPSLRPWLVEHYPEIYAAARERASGETGLALAAFPVLPPFSAEEALDLQFWPDTRATDR